MHPFLQRLQAFIGRLRRSPRLLGALVVLAVIIFVILVALLMVTTPEHSFMVTCQECNGRFGDLVLVDGDGVLSEQVVVVVEVTDEAGLAVPNATVTLKAEDENAKATTDEMGVASLTVNATLAAGEMQTFLSLSVDKSNFYDYSSDAFVTIVRQ